MSWFQVNADFVSSVADRPAKWLLELASEEKVSMIVMGCRNTNKAQKALLGSTTDYILHNAKCPVAICHSHRGLFGKPRGHAERRPYRDVETQTEEPPPCPCGRAFGAKEWGGLTLYALHIFVHFLIIYLLYIITIVYCYLDNQMSQVVVIFPHGGQVYPIRSWLMMTWRHKRPGHH